MSSGSERAARWQVGAGGAEPLPVPPQSGRGGAGLPCAPLSIPPQARLLAQPRFGAQRGLRLRSEEVLSCLPPATHSSTDSPARVRNQTQPHGWATAQVAAMLMALPRQSPAVRRSCLPRGHRPSSTFPIFFPVKAKSSEVNSSPAPRAEAGTQVTTLQHRSAAGATCRLPAPAVPLRMERDAAMGLAGNYAHLPQT